MRLSSAVALTLVTLSLMGSQPTGVRAQQTPPARPQQPINLNFQDVDLAYLFGALARFAGINIVHSNLPARTVTMISAQPVAISELPGMIRSLAAAHGISISEGNGFLTLQGPGAGDQMP